MDILDEITSTNVLEGRKLMSNLENLFTTMNNLRIEIANKILYEEDYNNENFDLGSTVKAITELIVTANPAVMARILKETEKTFDCYLKDYDNFAKCGEPCKGYGGVTGGVTAGR